MKNFALASIVCGAFVASACAQSIFLNPGESYVFSFDAGSLPPPIPSMYGNFVGGGFGFVVNGGGEHASCLWQVEMFENSVNETPIFVYVQDRIGDCSLQPLIGGAWQDLQGVVRVTAGSSTLVSPMEVEITMPSANGYLYYDAQIQAVPEPSTLALTALGGFGLLAAARTRRRQT